IPDDPLGRKDGRGRATGFRAGLTRRWPLAGGAILPFTRGANSLRHGHQLEYMAVGILEIDAAAATPIVELAVIETPRRAAVGDFGLFDTAEDGVKLRHR